MGRGNPPLLFLRRAMKIYSVSVNSGYEQKFENLIKNMNILGHDEIVSIIEANDIVAVPVKESNGSVQERK